MKRLFITNDTQENKISYCHIVAFVAALFLDRFYSELILISFIVHTLIHGNKQKLRSVLTFQSLAISSVFFISVIGLIYTHDKAQGLKDIQKQSAILLFPLFLTASGIDMRKYKMDFLKVFSFTCVVIVLYLYMDAIRILLYNKLPLTDLFTQIFINHNFSEPANLHATYLSMYVLLAIAVFLYSFFTETTKASRIIYLLSILILLAGLLQLASRSVWISAIIIAPCFPFFILKGVKRLRLIVVMTVASGIAIFLITSISSFKIRYVEQFKGDLIQASVNNELPEPRIIRWHYVIEVIKQSPLYGHGSGSEQRLLNETYFVNKLYNSYLHQLNAHNQYLSILLKTGIWGLLIFLLTLFAGFTTAFRNRDILFFSFMIIISTVSVSENLLDVNKGIFFYAFFFSLFILSGKPFYPFLRLKRKQEIIQHPEPVNKTEHAAVISNHHHI